MHVLKREVWECSVFRVVYDPAVTAMTRRKQVDTDVCQVSKRNLRGFLRIRRR